MVPYKRVCTIAAEENFLIRYYDILGPIGTGTFSEVVKAVNKENGKIVACKILDRKYSYWRNVREVFAAEAFPEAHPNILQLIEVHHDLVSERTSLIYDLMDSDLCSLLHGNRSHEPLPNERVRPIMHQIFSALAFLHMNGLFHSDLKPENILLRDPNDLVKVGDFGNILKVHGQLPRSNEYAATCYYRAPECILTNGYYGLQIDIWSAGCIFYELLTRKVLFPEKDESDLIWKIHAVVGSPPYHILQHFCLRAEDARRTHGPSSPCHKKFLRIEASLNHLKGLPRYAKGPQDERPRVDLFKYVIPKDVTEEANSLLRNLLKYDPSLRLSALAAMDHPYFKTDPIETQ